MAKKHKVPDIINPIPDTEKQIFVERLNNALAESKNNLGYNTEEAKRVLKNIISANSNQSL
ncbi:MAG: hypothetical protein M0D57_11395 [Sphingobacteriales bacterium JAD_PAG50586_3]|nr:MAG: hypothetical protein M0D57_11395 [Sphingobacteriales bacterium JAD_PAG50586_3]